ncbi:hypothetical protein QCA50_004714 [Cerrena zonata]|uniref:2OGFeDO JBP1/TET oxygenase domain-containing protein n=1 Tax=Cerrena zonata TaxID=2478898 RepID=A0AAW0FHT5_9APHY
MHQLFKVELARQTGLATSAASAHPPKMSDECKEEYIEVVRVLVRAFLNPVKVSWDIQKYQLECTHRCISGGMQRKEISLARDFPGVRSGIRAVLNPRTVIDVYGRIIVWILPSILPKRIQDIYQKCAGEIAGEMQNELAAHRQSRSWRFLSTLFSQVNDSIPPGLINFSAAWFMLGREGREDSLVTSPILRSARGKQWMRDMAEVGTLLSGVLRIMHPDQYRMGYEVMTGLMHYEQVNLALSTWPSVFNAATVISNRCCPMHRDNKGSFPLFDILISTGDYSNAPISILPVGIQFPNGPGSMCGFSGFGFRHGVAGADAG